jgi:DNA-binding transcriptional LysR family regulator
MIRFLPPLTARLAAARPGLALEAVPLDARHFELKLAAGDAGLRRQPLYIDKYVCIARRAHPELRRLRTAAGFRRARHILVTASDIGHGAHEAAQRAVDAAIAPDTVRILLPSFVAAAVVASRTDGVAIVPANLARALTGLGLAAFRPLAARGVLRAVRPALITDPRDSAESRAAQARGPACPGFAPSAGPGGRALASLGRVAESLLCQLRCASATPRRALPGCSRSAPS